MATQYHLQGTGPRFLRFVCIFSQTTFYAVLRVEELSFEKEADVYAKVKLGDVEKKTQTVAKSSSPVVWNESFPL